MIHLTSSKNRAVCPAKAGHQSVLQTGSISGEVWFYPCKQGRHIPVCPFLHSVQIIVALHKGVSQLQQMTFESAHNKTYNKTCVTSKDSDQPDEPVHLPSIAWVLIILLWISLRL